MKTVRVSKSMLCAKTLLSPHQVRVRCVMITLIHTLVHSECKVSCLEPTTTTHMSEATSTQVHAFNACLSVSLSLSLSIAQKRWCCCHLITHTSLVNVNLCDYMRLPWCLYSVHLVRVVPVHSHTTKVMWICKVIRIAARVVRFISV